MTFSHSTAARRLFLATCFTLACFALGAQQPPPPAVAPRPLLSPIFGDNMVVQRGKAATLWGWSTPGDAVRISFAGQAATATAGPDGRWTATVQPPAAGGPYTLAVAAHGAELEVKNILVGDVWLCAGQSNMEFGLRGVENSAAVIAAASDPQIRFFTVGAHAAFHATATPQGTWKAVTPQTADRLSAVAYFFAKRVQAETHIPIGLVIDAVGGTTAETWMSEGSLTELAGYEPTLATLRTLQSTDTHEYGNYVMPWYDQYDAGLKAGWFRSDFADADWKPVTLPGGFAELGVPATPAIAYFRRTVTLPNPLPAGRAMLRLGIVERMDTVWVNATEVGGSAWVENPRAYVVPPGTLHPGANSVVVRVLKTKPDGGFLSNPDELRIELGDGSRVALAGAWKGRVSLDARPPQPLPVRYENWPVVPTVLYNGMVAPLAPLAITGVLWYQGEANSDQGFQYRNVLPALIADWRRTFAQPLLPFYIAGLPAYQQRSSTPTDDGWADVRDSQALTVAQVPHTCLAVTIDTGDPETIHPKDKAPVGDRLARCALAEHYGLPVVAQGPTLTSSELQQGAVLLHFSHADGGLVVKDNGPGAFQIAGADHKWYWADAHVVNGMVVVSTSLVQQPTAVRYAWQSNPHATLFNGAGLPAAPFRTDTLPEATEGRPVYGPVGN